MTPGLVHFVCPQGSTFKRTLTYTLDDTPIDLSGYSARLQVREAYYSANTLISISTGNGISISGPSGVITLNIDDLVTASVPAGVHVYDLEIESPSGDVDRLIEGEFRVTPEVTR